MDGLAQIPAGKGGVNLRLGQFHAHPAHQIVLNLPVLQRLQLQLHAAGQDRGQKRLRVGGEKQDHRVGGLLLDGLKQSVLGLHGHLLRLVHNVDLVGAAVGLHLNGIVDLPPHIVHADAGRFLMGHVDQVRMVPGHHLLAGVALAARVRLPLLAEQGQGECVRQGLLAHPRLA